MKPILHYHNETDFENNGIGVLADCTSCLVTEELNGKYELVMKYPIDGVLFSEIKLRSIVVAKPNKSDKTQPFRIYRITKPLKGVVTIYAEHISYDLSSIPVSPFSADDLGSAFVGLFSNSEIDNPFGWYSDKTGNIAKIDFTLPRNFRSMLGGDDPSILSTYGGEFYFDRFTINLLSHRGADRGVQIRYGKNLIDLKQEENISKTYTGIYPYYTDGSGNAYVLPEKILYAEGNFEFTKILPVDLTNELGDINYITEDDFREVAKQYMVAHEFGKPTISINVSFIELADTEEYKDIALLESVDLGDTVEVIFEKMNIANKARISKTIYNVLTERYDSVTVGEMQANIADNMASVPNKTKEYIKKEDTTNRLKLEEAIRLATELLNGANGGVFEILDENGDGINDGWIIRSYDSSEYIKAVLGGIGITTDGGKTYQTAITPSGINADTITAGKVIAEHINGDGLDVSNAKIDNCEIAEDCKIYGTVFANKISSYTNEDEGHDGSIEYLHGSDFDILGMFLLNRISSSKAQISMLTGNFASDPDQNSSILISADNYVDGAKKKATLACQKDSTILMYDDSSVSLTSEGAQVAGKYVSAYGIIHLVGDEEEINLINGKWQANGAWDIYGQWNFSLTPTFGSDTRLKNSISDLSEKYSDFFDNLRPVICKHNADKSGKFHVNFIAQEVLEAIDKSGLSESDFAGVSENNGMLSLAYTEFIPLLTAEIQKLKREIKDIKEQINIKG